MQNMAQVWLKKTIKTLQFEQKDWSMSSFLWCLTQQGKGN